ncbi:MAG TPA: serine acetyltransferase [Cyclobacteriaceae bacterium]|nr:serine acetyltransferase [Cyclobacteriaceae bacterium]
MEKEFINRLYLAHKSCLGGPPPTAVVKFFKDLLSTLFPDFAVLHFNSIGEFELHIEKMKLQLDQLLFGNPVGSVPQERAITERFFKQLPMIHSYLVEDVDAIFQGDPAARSKSEVIRTYPGFYAVAAYRVAHELDLLGVQEIPRIITEHSHSKTGIDIHPSAKIGRHFCIDHGTGVVIGETSDIGNYVKIYQGVTLGALSVNKVDSGRKRHPTIEDHVIIYAGASILGGNTVVGRNSIIGGNVWLTKSVPPDSKIYYQSKVNSSDLPDPIGARKE